MSVKREGLERLAKGVAKVIGDWNWTGGKPGEITGGDILREIPSGRPMFGEQRNLMDAFVNQLRGSTKSGDRFNRLLDEYALVQQRSMDLMKRPASGVVSPSREIAKRFYALENAGVPREYTGAIERYFGRSDTLPNMAKNTKLLQKKAKEMSNLMRSMTDDQRQTFLNLLPTWLGTMKDAAVVAKKVYNR